MLKIIIACKLPPPYLGTSVWAETLSNSKLNSFFEIKYFNNNTHRSITTIGKFRLWGAIANFLLYFRFLAEVISFRPDLVLIPFSQSAWGFIKDSFFMLISLGCRRKTLLILHGSNFRNWLSTQNWLIQWYCRKIICSSKGVIVLGNKLTALFSDWLGKEKVFVVPNGLDVVIPTITRKKATGVQLVYLGNLQASKGVEDLVEAMRYIKSNEEILLDIVGSWREPETRNNCLSLQEKYKLPIHFMDALYAEKKLQVLAESDIFIFPPRMPEGHPFVIIEAMACGLPIISTDQGAITESVLEGINGFIVPANSPREIAAKIQFLIDNPGIREKMGRESQRLYKENFTEDKMIDKLAAVFTTVLNRN